MLSCLDDFTRIPYLENGRDENGCDCYGLVWLYYRHILKIELPDYPNANHGPKHASPLFITEIYKYFDRLCDNDTVKMGDLVLIKNESDKPDHIGVMIDDTRMMQSNEKYNVSIARVSRFKSSIYGIYRHGSLI